MTYRYIEFDGEEVTLLDAEELGRAVAIGRITRETRLHHDGRWGPAERAPIVRAALAAREYASEEVEEGKQGSGSPGATEPHPSTGNGSTGLAPRTRQMVALGLLLVLVVITLSTQSSGPFLLLLILVGLALGALAYVWWMRRPEGAFSWRTAWTATAFGCAVPLALTAGFTNPGESDLVLSAVGYGIGSGILYGGPATLFLSGTRLATR